MAITFANGGTYQVVMQGFFNTTNAVRNVFHLHLLDGGPIDQGGGLADIEDWLVEIYGYLATITSDLVTYSSFIVNALEGVNTSGNVALSAPITGDLTDDPLPPAVAMLSYFPTGEKRRQLRKYWGGWTEGSIGSFGGFSSAVALGVTTNLAPLFLLPYEGANGAWLYGHYTTGVPGSFIGAQSMLTTANPVTQRRRRVGRGA